MNYAEIFKMVLETLLMTFISTFLAYLIGLPTGILLNVTSKKGIRPNKTINLIVGSFINLLRSIPCLIIIVLCMPISRKLLGSGTGKWYTIIIPLTICAYGFVSRMVEQALFEVDSNIIEAIKSLGANNFQLVFKVLLVEAKPSLISGLSVVLVSVLGYTSFAYNIGAGGLISSIYTFFTRNTASYFTKVYFWILIVLIVIIVQVIQELGLYIAKKIDKRRIIKWKETI